MPDLFENLARDDKDYTARDIEVLEGLEPVRRRPGMYIGGSDERAMHHLVAELLDNAMDEAVAGHASRIELELGADAEGIHILDPSMTVGQDLATALGVTTDVLFDLDIEGNRPDALSVAGGFTPFADKRRVKVIRYGQEGEMEFVFDYKKYVNGEAPGSNILLQAGDTIVVPD